MSELRSGLIDISTKPIDNCKSIGYVASAMAAVPRKPPRDA